MSRTRIIDTGNNVKEFFKTEKNPEICEFHFQRDGTDRSLTLTNSIAVRDENNFDLTDRINYVKYKHC